jgi:hypothetical protein
VIPLGISAVTGIVLTFLMFSSQLLFTPNGVLVGSPLPSETKVKQVGELPVDVLKTSEITFLSSQQADGKDGVKKFLNPQNAFAPALHLRVKANGQGKLTCQLQEEVYPPAQ